MLDFDENETEQYRIAEYEGLIPMLKRWFGAIQYRFAEDYGWKNIWNSKPAMHAEAPGLERKVSGSGSIQKYF